MPAHPLVTVLINNYNYGRYLQCAIDSALEQRDARFEIVVVDDGSKDESRDIIAGYGNAIKAVLKPNGGQASAFNAGFAVSSGEIICFLDSDDFFAPDKISAIRGVFENHTDIGWCFDRVRKFDHATGREQTLEGEWSPGEVDQRRTLTDGCAPEINTVTSGISVRRAVLAEILPMPEIIRITSDGFIKLALLSLARGWNLAETVTMQRIHGENLYTDRPGGSAKLMRRTGILTGISLWERYPHLERLGTRLFTRAIAMSLLSGDLDRDGIELAKSYWSRLPVLSKAEVVLSAAVWGARDVIRRPPVFSAQQKRSPA